MSASDPFSDQLRNAPLEGQRLGVKEGHASLVNNNEVQGAAETPMVFSFLFC